MKDVDQKIADLLAKNKGKYITQAVAFNKECPRQMELLRFALSESSTFSGLVKEMLALRKQGIPTGVQSYQPQSKPSYEPITSVPEPSKPSIKNVGNFI